MGLALDVRLGDADWLRLCVDDGVIVELLVKL